MPINSAYRLIPTYGVLRVNDRDDPVPKRMLVGTGGPPTREALVENSDLIELGEEIEAPIRSHPRSGLVCRLKHLELKGPLLAALSKDMWLRNT